MSLLTVQAQVVVGQDGGLVPRAVHGHEQFPAVRVHALLANGAGGVATQAPRYGELQLDVLQLNIVHAVGGHGAANTQQKHN